MAGEALISILLFAFAWWLGLYLIARSKRKLGVLFAGFGLAAYALAIAADMLNAAEPNSLAGPQQVLSVLPALFWALAILLLIRRETDAPPRRPLGLLIVAAIFFGLSTGLFIVNLLPRFAALVLIGIDLGFLGFAMARLNAFDESESLLPDFVRSLLASMLEAVAFGGVTVVAASFIGFTTPLLALAFAIVALSITSQVFAPQWQSFLDRIVLPPRLQQARTELREVTEALPRSNESLDPNTLDEAEFTRLTRRALTYMGDLPKLAVSPLTRLAIIDQRLAARGAPDNPLDRAVELKAVLAEQIVRLKPDGKGDFGTTDEWRHYNALYFPYVAGLKPYSVRAEHNGLDPTSKAALEWFRTSVPERTLHNWQTAAAKLVAQELRRA